MNHFATKAFWQTYDALPKHIQKLADENHALLEADESHPSLHFKRVRAFWSVRVGAHYRALGIQTGDDLVWFWIGHHSVYDRLIS